MANPDRGLPRRGGALTFEGFDPGSERTLAAWIRHASRTNPTWGSNTSGGGSGERGSKAWATYPGDGHSRSIERVIPSDPASGHPQAGKSVSPREGRRDCCLVGG